MKKQKSALKMLGLLFCVIVIMLTFRVNAFAAGVSGPSSADLDAIHSDIKYPNYAWMYLDEYISAVVTPQAVYCFKDPDTDIWRKGNVYTVSGGTEVTILAKSEGYACVILTGTCNAGWINEDYLYEQYSYTNGPVKQQALNGCPGPKDLQGCNEQVQHPKSGNWLQNYETKYLKTKYGVRAYLRYKPSSDLEYYDYVYERAQVTVLARENGYSLVKTNDGMAGWVTSSLLYDNYPGYTTSEPTPNSASPSSATTFAISDGNYDCTIVWSDNSQIVSAPVINVVIGQTIYSLAFNSASAIHVYGWGHDGYHDIIYAYTDFAELYKSVDRFDFWPGNESSASVTVVNGQIDTLWVLYHE